MTDRVSRLRDESLRAEPWISGERAELMTRFYRDHAAGLSVPVARAKSLAYLLEHKTICFNPGELIALRFRWVRAICTYLLLHRCGLIFFQLGPPSSQL